MAGAFGCDPAVARQVSRELAEIRAGMASLDDTFNRLDGATGSAAVERALDRFVDHSSERRKKLEGLLERASGMFLGLADGTAEVDAALYAAVAAGDVT